jgi:hypothetical protein
MSDTNTPDNKAQIQLYQEKGLTEKEAQVLMRYIEDGKPGLAKARSESMRTIYTLGYSCEEIHEMFPEYSLGLILHARITHEWDKTRVDLSEKLSKIKENVIISKLESVQFLTEMLKAVHVKHRQDILRFLANPDREDAPKVLPNSLHGYQQILTLLDEVMGNNQNKDSKSSDFSASPLVSVTINTDQPKTVEAKVGDSKAILRKKADAIRGKNPKNE